MSNVPKLSRNERTIVVLMRIFGCGGVLAIPAIFLPHSWMNAIHEFAGLGQLPETPIVSYLARSLSAFYAALGSITLYVSLDIRHYRGLIRFWAGTLTVFGCCILGIDFVSGMPLHWTLSEGPPTIAAGLVLLWLHSSIQSPQVTS